MQILPRKGKYVDPATIALCRSMLDDFDTLPGERLFEEFRKLLMKSDKPSMGLQFLTDCGWITKFPELDAMRYCPQHPVYHPEGDVWTHTLLVIDKAAEERQYLPDDWKLAYMFGMLLHDVGKPVTTDRETFSANGHDTLGVPLAKQFMARLTNEIDLIDKTLAIVETHMRSSAMHKAQSTPGAWRRLHNHVPLQILARVTLADSRGRTGETGSKPVPEFDTCLQYSEEFGTDRIKPLLQGRHLIERGHTPGPEFTKILNRAFQFQLDSGCVEVDELYNFAVKDKS
ncbi:MAG: HD domain-containing protein [Ignavibacteriales bacterium]|nr:HD domain-containing protein [Ignavibacteriales bacterium]